MEITETMTRESYKVARQVYLAKISHSDGIRHLTYRAGMNKGSANDLVRNLRHMLVGEEYHRTMNFFTTRHVLEKIRLDFDDTAFRNALDSVRKHLDYYDSLKKGKHPKLRELLRSLRSDPPLDEVYPDQVDLEDVHFEGATKQVAINVYERNPQARKKCIEMYGYQCTVCAFNFESVYGEIGRSFIHVHHLIELSSIGKEYVVDPIMDLRPVCPNCHAMLHKQKPPFSIEELRSRLSG